MRARTPPLATVAVTASGDGVARGGVRARTLRLPVPTVAQSVDKSSSGSDSAGAHGDGGVHSPPVDTHVSAVRSASSRVDREGRPPLSPPASRPHRSERAPDARLDAASRAVHVQPSDDAEGEEDEGAGEDGEDADRVVADEHAGEASAGSGGSSVDDSMEGNEPPLSFDDALAEADALMTTARVAAAMAAFTPPGSPSPSAFPSPQIHEGHNPNVELTNDDDEILELFRAAPE
ncbi:hypothetical protein EON68_00325 [archaeon]|nr:MAG: hypothetical protein EON68_00325 [archaeon]